MIFIGKDSCLTLWVGLGIVSVKGWKKGDSLIRFVKKQNGVYEEKTGLGQLQDGVYNLI